MSGGTVSVIIPCFDGEQHVGEAVASVLAQTHRDLEVVVVDDGSRDRSLDVLAKIGDTRLRVVRQANAGVSAARNRGVGESRGEFVAFLDQDDAWMPEKLERQLRCLDRSPDVGLVYCDFYYDVVAREASFRWSARYPLYRGDVFERVLAMSVIPISTVLLRRSTFDATGGFPPCYRYVEDLALLLRVAARHPFDFVDQPLARYRHHATSTSRVLGLEVAIDELVDMCERWMAEDPALAPAIARALGEAFYVAGKTAFYNGNEPLARRYLGEAWRRRRVVRARIFDAVTRCAPGVLRRAYTRLDRAPGGV